MRKNSIRKLIHGILDLLPLFVIPIFAININQKSVEPISIEVQEKEAIDFNQLITEITDFDETIRGVDIHVQDNVWTINGTPTSNAYSVGRYYFNTIANHKYYIRPNVTGTTMGNSTWQYYVEGTIVRYAINNIILTANTTGQASVMFAFYNTGNSINATFTNQVYDLTKMYGVGNEPTATAFDTYFSNYYYPYTESQKMLVDKPTPTTYDDTDIGSQFLYSLYISTDNYFNMNNVFNLNSVYSWFEMNIFGGSAPLSIYIVWNIIIYELVMDLLMLLYALFMFFIDACQKLIDKPLESIK